MGTDIGGGGWALLMGRKKEHETGGGRLASSTAKVKRLGMEKKAPSSHRNPEWHVDMNSDHFHFRAFQKQEKQVQRKQEVNMVPAQ